MVNVYTSKDLTPEALLTAGPVLLDLWAPWCGPCRMVSPLLEQLSEEYAGKLTFAKINIDEFGSDAVQLGVMSIPTMIIFKDGEEVDRMIGAAPKAEIKEMIDKHI